MKTYIENDNYNGIAPTQDIITSAQLLVTKIYNAIKEHSREIDSIDMCLILNNDFAVTITWEGNFLVDWDGNACGEIR